MFSTLDLDENERIPIVKTSIYSLYIKRLLDILLSGCALVVLLPILLILAISELIFHGRPILYASQRPGLNGDIFDIYKFRSMTNETDENGQLLAEELRLTKFGIFLRRTSLDELPELWSIFTGKMSIVGPRPLLTEYLDLYSPRHKMRHLVRPGLALMRIKGNKNEEIPDRWTWRDQFENDICYIENVSFILDVKMILAIAAEVVIGSPYRTNDTRVKFDGNNLDDTRSKQEALQEALKIN